MRKFILLLATCVVSASAYAGKEVRGVDKDLGAALDKTVAAVERAAAVHGTCVSEYPKLEKCNSVHDHWQCVAIRANHKGSCASKPSDLDNVIKAAKGLSGPAAKAAIAGGAQ